MGEKVAAKPIVFEGVNRAGKTTHAKLLFDFLKSQIGGFHTKEPQANGAYAIGARGPISRLPQAQEALRKFIRA